MKITYAVETSDEHWNVYEHEEFPSYALASEYLSSLLEIIRDAECYVDGDVPACVLSFGGPCGELFQFAAGGFVYQIVTR